MRGTRFKLLTSKMNWLKEKVSNLFFDHIYNIANTKMLMVLKYILVCMFDGIVFVINEETIFLQHDCLRPVLKTV